MTLPAPLKEEKAQTAGGSTASNTHTLVVIGRGGVSISKRGLGERNIRLFNKGFRFRNQLSRCTK